MNPPTVPPGMLKFKPYQQSNAKQDPINNKVNNRMLNNNKGALASPRLANNNSKTNNKSVVNMFNSPPTGEVNNATKIKNLFEESKWYTYNHYSKRLEDTKEVMSYFIENEKIQFDAQKLPGTNSSAYGTIYELMSGVNGVKNKYVLKFFKIYDMHDFNTFKNEVKVGSMEDVSNWGTKIYCHSLFNVSNGKFVKIEDIQSSSYDVSGFLGKNSIVGLYIMDHVLKGNGRAKFTSLKNFKRKFLKKGVNDKLRQNLLKKLKHCLRAFYKIPKIHGDLHDSNILVIYHMRVGYNNLNNSNVNPNVNYIGESIIIDQVCIIDYGTTFVIPKLVKTWNESDSLDSIFKTMKTFLEVNYKPFMNKSSNVYPENSNIYLYNIKGGGQQLRSNKQLLDLYVKDLVTNVIKINSKRRSAPTEGNSVSGLPSLTPSKGFFSQIFSALGFEDTGSSKYPTKKVSQIGKKVKKPTSLAAKNVKSSKVVKVKKHVCGNCKCYKSGSTYKGPKGGQFYIQSKTPTKVYCKKVSSGKMKSCKKQCSNKSKTK